MNQAIELFHSMSDSIHKNCKDCSILTALEKSLFTLQPESIDPQVYSRLMLSIYDLSNHHTLLSSQSAHPPDDAKLVVHSLGVRLKLIAMRMICVLMQLMMSGSSNMDRLEREI